VFRRRRNDQNDPEPEAGLGDVESTESDDSEGTTGEDGAARTVDRAQGPFDASEVPDDGISRLDLGGMLVPGAEGMELRLELDEAAESVVAVTIVDGSSSMQLMAFAAPRTDGIWDDVREEIRVNLASQGPVDVVDGRYGPELHASIPVAGPQGQQQIQAVRFIGIDGPRWFLRALVAGAAARDAAAAATLEAVLRAVVVVRGNDPMAPGDQLPLSVPETVPEGMERSAEGGRTTLPLPERGPEITEIR
jgi:hypothetical protein